MEFELLGVRIQPVLLTRVSSWMAHQPTIRVPPGSVHSTGSYMLKFNPQPSKHPHPTSRHVDRRLAGTCRYRSLFCSSARVFIRRNPNLPFVSSPSVFCARSRVGCSVQIPSGSSVGTVRSELTMASASKAASVHDFTVKDARGNDVDLGIYKGKALLIVNVASQCGLTNSNYTELAQLYQKYKDQGLEILAFPCNQFGGQEPGTNEQIVEFACTRFKAEYPIFDKVDVNGNNAAPIYKFLKSSKGGFLGDGIKWNFAKFLVDKDGKVVDRYAPTTSPLSIEKDVKKLLSVA